MQNLVQNSMHTHCVLKPAAALLSWLQTKVFDMKSALEGRIQRAEEIANTLQHFKREVALAAEHSKTGRPISQKLLADFEAKGESPRKTHTVLL